MLPESLWADLVIGGGRGEGEEGGRKGGTGEWGKGGRRNDTLDTWLRVIIIP